MNSPFRAILDYETAHNIPLGWINHSISASGKHGAWSQLETGSVPLDATFFANFQRDLSDESRWRVYYASHLQKQHSLPRSSSGAEEAAFQAPPVPQIDAEWLYWSMMRIGRTPDKHMYPALKALRKHADGTSRKPPRLIVAALSNTSIFPEGHEFNDPSTPEGKQHVELRSQFDLFVSSAHVGMRKPDREIYDYTIAELDKLARSRGDETGIKAGDIVFLDDIGANLKMAKQVGMRTIKVVLEKSDLAVKELEQITGLKLASSDAPQTGVAKSKL